MLKYARDEIGLSIEEASKNIMNKDKLYKAEAGKIQITFNQLIQISKRYKLPITFFYLKEPRQDSLITKFRSIKSKEVRLTSELRKSFYEIRQKRNLAIEFRKYDSRDYNYDFVNSIDLETSIKDAAAKIKVLFSFKKTKSNWKNQYNALNNWMKAIEDLGVLVFQVSNIPLEVMRGFSISEIPYPTIVINRSDIPVARIYSIIHEFVHIISADKEVNAFSTGLYDPKKNPQAKIETFCNKVTAEILMPEKEFLQHKKIKTRKTLTNWTKEEIINLSKQFWVSQKAVLIRMKTLSLINNEEFNFQMKELDKILPKSGFEYQQHLKVIRKNSDIFLNNLLTAYAEREVTGSKLTRILNMKLVHLENLEKEFWKRT